MPGTNYQSILDQCTEEASQARGDMARAMRDVDPEKLIAARNRDRDVREHVQAISDQRTYGSGCDFDPRGIRDLHGRGDDADQNKVRSGFYQHSNESAVYPEAGDSGVGHNRLEPEWASNGTMPRPAGRRRR
jgi:hypothetical protein